MIVVIRKLAQVGLKGRTSESMLNIAAERLGIDTSSCIEIRLPADDGCCCTYKASEGESPRILSGLELNPSRPVVLKIQVVFQLMCL